MNYFDLRLVLFGINIHAFTFLTSVILWICVFMRSRVLREWGLVVATLAVMINIHLYETFHAFSEFFVTGRTGNVVFNLSVLIIGFLLTYILNSKYNIIGSFKQPIIAGGLFVFSMILLIWSGYFENYPYNIVFGPMWGTTKVLSGVTIYSLFSLKQVKATSSDDRNGG